MILDTSKVKLVDLSTPFDTEYSVGMPPFEYEKYEIKPIRTFGRDGRRTSEFTLNCHIGTHIDAPMHACTREEKEGKWYLGDIPLEQLFGETVVLDIPKGLEEPYGAPITAEDLEKASSVSKELEIREGDIVLVHTGWGHYFVDEPKTGDYIFYKGPGLEESGAKWLVKKKIKGYGQDTCGTQWKKTFFFPTPEEKEHGEKHLGEHIHRIMLLNDIVLLEHLYNLDKIAGRRVICGFFPLPFKDIEASPMRAVAFVEA